ncbi:MAG: recombinase family protein [Candidatus Omnitrophica bacterium]|jgi:DNA invertase Pin-like site-specific DNA recombinase|nr:recombinase family protein [Candidatus Omnitrophota bacterium]
MDAQEKKIINCAIYTRKSTSDGLEQDFTSLDAQRESAESYIASQKNEGWVTLPERYDDGGFTGANTDRPALQRLITDIKTSKINCVVVYKVDRLSRSLLNFAELLSLFEKHNTTFVSVTQHFNTQNSMGRLTLNILLSFAQFEREIISERTRDKMAAAKKKGKWIGGRPPLGYNIDKEKHKLLINHKEAKLVRGMFDLYLEKRSVLAVTINMNNKGYTTKQYMSEKGLRFGGIKFKVTGVYNILTSVLYIGKVEYHGEFYQGEQEPIISEDIFQKVQKILAENKPDCKITKRNKHVGLLSGMLRCKACDAPMYFTYNVKANKYKYHYYACMNASKRGYKSCPVRLLNAQKIEDKVIESLRTIVHEPKLNEDTWDRWPLQEKIAVIKPILKEAIYDGNNQILDIFLNKNDKEHSFKVALTELKNIPTPPHKESIKKEPQLRQNLILAHQVEGILTERKAKGLKEVASWLNLNHQRLNQIMNLLLLSPTIQEEILCSENANISLIPEYKLRDIAFELGWDKQLEMWQELLRNRD